MSLAQFDTKFQGVIVFTLVHAYFIALRAIFVSPFLIQHLYKVERYITGVMDEEGYPAFSLVNKATKHSIADYHPLTQ